MAAQVFGMGPAGGLCADACPTVEAVLQHATGRPVGALTQTALGGLPREANAVAGDLRQTTIVR